MSKDTRVRSTFVVGKDIAPFEAKSVFNKLTVTAQDMFADTSFVKGGNVSGTDLETLRNFYAQAAEISPDILNESTQRHLQLVARYARFFGESLNNHGYNFDLNELEALALLHDFGRTFSHHRGRNDLIAGLLMREAGFRKEFTDLLPNGRDWMPITNGSEIDENATWEKLSTNADKTLQQPEKLIIEVSDALSRFRDGRLIRPDEINAAEQESQAIPDESASWPSEQQRQRGIKIYYEKGGSHYPKWFAWMEKELGFPIVDAVEKTEKDLSDDPILPFSKQSI